VSTPLGLGHRSHKWLGRTVTDSVTGKRGLLRAITLDDATHGHMVAWLAPEGGGVEWTTDPSALHNPSPVTPDTSAKGER